MIRTLPALLLFAAVQPALAAGPIGIMARGAYVCEMPNDATVNVGVRVPEHDFQIVEGSHYASEGGTGVYLRRGDVLTFTSGPRKGQQFQVESGGFVRLMVDGEAGRLRCVRLSR